MKRKLPPDAPKFVWKFGWKRQRTRHGVEFFHYPSELARELWLYPVAVGRATTRPGPVIQHKPQDYYLLHFVTRGALWHEVKNRVHLARRGEVCLMDISKGAVHGVEGKHPAVSYWVSFNGRDMARHFVELRADRSPVFSALNVARMASLFRDLREMTAHEDAGYEPRAAGLLLLILAELHASRARAQKMFKLGDRNHYYSEPVRKGIDWMIRMYGEPCPLKQLAASVGYSRSHYSRRFRRDTGLSPRAWLTRFRVEQAKRLLAQSDKPVAEVAVAVGIPDQNYFARVFRSCTGTTPLRYRLAPRGRQRDGGGGSAQVC